MEYEPREVGLVGRKGPADKQPFLVGYMDMAPELLSRRARSLRARRWAKEDPHDISYSDNSYAEYRGGQFICHISAGHGLSDLTQKLVRFAPNRVLFKIRFQYILARRAKMYWNLMYIFLGFVFNVVIPEVIHFPLFELHPSYPLDTKQGNV